VRGKDLGFGRRIFPRGGVCNVARSDRGGKGKRMDNMGFQR